MSGWARDPEALCLVWYRIDGRRKSRAAFLLSDTIDPMQHRLSQPLQLVFLMFAALFHVLSMFLPSRLLTLPNVSESMEININPPGMIKRDSDTGTSSMPTATGQSVDESTADQGALSSTASSLSDRLDTAEAETETPRSLTPESSVEGEDSPSRKKILSLSGLWTQRNEKVR